MTIGQQTRGLKRRRFDLTRGTSEGYQAYDGPDTSVLEKEDFLDGAKYTDKVLEQIRQDDFHAFPESVLGFQDSGQVHKIIGGDGIARNILKIQGEYRGKKGTFEIIKEADGTINHRLFKPDIGK